MAEMGIIYFYNIFILSHVHLPCDKEICVNLLKWLNFQKSFGIMDKLKDKGLPDVFPVIQHIFEV